jgi:hypothetical protein
LDRNGLQILGLVVTRESKLKINATLKHISDR